MAISTNTDWRAMKTGSECLKSLFLSETLCDVVFTFKQPGARQLPAHRFVLAMRSPVFEAMFYGPMKDNKTEILLEDDTPEAFELLLKYVYTDDVSLNWETILSCLYTANKYLIDGLVKTCSDYLGQSISNNNACTIYEQAKFLDIVDLRSRCFTYMMKNSDEIFASEEFLSVSQDTLTTILADDSIRSKEENIFSAAIKWATNQCTKANVEATSCKLRNYMGDSFYKIRFPLIPIDVFARTVTPVGVLTDNEQVMLYQYIATKDTQTLKQVGKFTSAERNAGKVTVLLDMLQLTDFEPQQRIFFQICPSRDILLYEIKGQLNADVTNFKSVIELYNLSQKHMPVKNAISVDSKVVNGSIKFEKPIFLKGGQTTALKTGQSIGLMSFRCNGKANSRNVAFSARILYVPVGTEAIVITES